MIGFRIMAIVVGLICLASASLIFFHNCPQTAPVNAYLIRNFIPPGDVQAFIKSSALPDVEVKNIIKYIVSGYAIFALGIGLLFFCAAVNPLRMRPFVVVVMIGAILWIGVAIWKGLSLGIYKTWWIGDAACALILLVLLAALFPKRAKPKIDEDIREEESLEE
ncbi:MAG: hypothetical protein RAO92_05010 [Candidatus Euphemobacter frigidus]|nr:hypothetical protein [Candidatus Euphemobacter frigidus]MDP8275743.1 hypothetical protein [Candidatus Euphemobacter frigidus]